MRIAMRRSRRSIEQNNITNMRLSYTYTLITHIILFALYAAPRIFCLHVLCGEKNNNETTCTWSECAALFSLYLALSRSLSLRISHALWLSVVPFMPSVSPIACILSTRWCLTRLTTSNSIFIAIACVLTVEYHVLHTF